MVGIQQEWIRGASVYGIPPISNPTAIPTRRKTFGPESLAYPGFDPDVVFGARAQRGEWKTGIVGICVTKPRS